jgi:hypothetical protein
MPPLQLPVHHAAPKKPAPDDPTILTDAYALRERTFPEVTPDVHRRYLYFKRTAGQTTIMTLHELRELCRVTKNPTEGRAVVEKAINALLDQLRKALEAEVLQWTASQLILDYLEGRARAIDEALQTRELERAPLELAKAAAAKGVGQLHLKEEGKPHDSAAHKKPELPQRWAFSLPPPRSMSRQFSILIGSIDSRRSRSMTQTVTNLFSAVRYPAHCISSLGNSGGTK